MCWGRCDRIAGTGPRIPPVRRRACGAGRQSNLGSGEFLSIIGPNGAGKTTLFNLISGHDIPDEGSVRLDGNPITGQSPERIAAPGLARTFQHGRVFATMSVRDNVLIGAHHRLRAVRPGLGALGELLAALLRPRAVAREEAALRAEADKPGRPRSDPGSRPARERLAAAAHASGTGAQSDRSLDFPSFTAAPYGKPSRRPRGGGALIRCHRMQCSSAGRLMSRRNVDVVLPPCGGTTA